MQKLKICIGVFALCLLFSFNLRHALNDYGVSDPNNNLHPQVLAQTNTSGSTTGGDCTCSLCSTGSGTPGADGNCSGDKPNYAWLEKLVTKGVYEHQISINGRIEIVRDLPIGNVSYTVQWSKLLYSVYACEWPSIARCDQNKVGRRVEDGGST
jgi:hypothetical protein